MITLSDREKYMALVDADMPKKSDAIILLEGDGFYRIPKALELYRLKWADRIVVSGGIRNYKNGSYPADEIIARLLKEGIPGKAIIPENSSMNTREQALAISDLALKSGWKRIILVASHYHQYRAYLTFLKVIIDQHLSIEIINAPEKELAWFEATDWGIRFELLSEEFNKIEEYSRYGHVATFAQAIDYQKWKEKQI